MIITPTHTVQANEERRTEPGLHICFSENTVCVGVYFKLVYKNYNITIHRFIQHQLR